VSYGMASGAAAPGWGGPGGRMPRGRRRRGLMTFLPARTHRAPGWTCAQRGVSSPRRCAVEPVNASGAMAVFLTRCIARADWIALDLLAAGGRRYPLAPASPLPDIGMRATRWGFVWRPGPLRTAPGTMGLGLPFPGPEAPGKEPTRSHAVAPIRKEARFACRTGRRGATSRRGDCSNRGSTTRKVTE